MKLGQWSLTEVRAIGLASEKKKKKKGPKGNDRGKMTPSEPGNLLPLMVVSFFFSKENLLID